MGWPGWRLVVEVFLVISCLQARRAEARREYIEARDGASFALRVTRARCARAEMCRGRLLPLVPALHRDLYLSTRSGRVRGPFSAKCLQVAAT